MIIMPHTSAPSAWVQLQQPKSPGLGFGGKGSTWGGIPSACTAFLVAGPKPITPQCRTWFAQHPAPDAHTSQPTYMPDDWGGNRTLCLAE